MSTKVRRPHKVAKSKFIHQYGVRLRSDVKRLVDTNNSQVLPERRVSLASAIEVANRALSRTRSNNPSAISFAILREVSAFISLASNDRRTEASLRHADLLPVAHPASTKSHAMTASALRHARARWVAADLQISDEARPLVVSAFSAAPGTTVRSHAFARLSAMTAGAVPRYLTIDGANSASPIGLVAVGGFGIGGNSSAARSARAKMQRRDRKGRFAFMGGGFSFNIRLGDRIFSASGRVVGQSGDSDIQVEIADNPHVPAGIYALPSSKGLASKAILPREALTEIDEVQLDKATGGRESLVDASDITRVDVPSGWSRSESDDSDFEQFVSEDGYFARRNIETGDYSLHRADLTDNSVGEKVADGRSWADVQRAAKNDGPEYQKVLEKAAKDEQAGKTVAPTPAFVGDEGDAYDRIRDEMLEEGWSKSDPGYDAELMRRADEAGVPKAAPSTARTAPKPSVAREGVADSAERRKLVAWASKQDDEKLKSIASQAGKGLTAKQWAALDRESAKDPGFDSFMDLPSDMTPEQAQELTDWARSMRYDARHRVFNRSTDPNKPDIAIFEEPTTSSAMDVESFLSQDNAGFVSSTAWSNIKKAKADADSKGPDDIGAPLKVESSIRTPEERDIAAGTLLDQADNIIDRIDDMPDSPYRSYLASKADRKIKTANEISDSDNIADRVSASNEDLDAEISRFARDEDDLFRQEALDEWARMMDEEFVGRRTGTEEKPISSDTLSPDTRMELRDVVGEESKSIAREFEILGESDEDYANLAGPIRDAVDDLEVSTTAGRANEVYDSLSMLKDSIEKAYNFIDFDDLSDENRAQELESSFDQVMLSIDENMRAIERDFGTQAEGPDDDGDGGIAPPEEPTPEPDAPSGENLDVPEENLFDDIGESAADDAVDFVPGASPEESRAAIEQIIDSNGVVRFNYNGRERLFRPTGVWENAQNGNINMVGRDLGDGENKTYTIQRMDAPEKRPAPGSGEPIDIVDSEFSSVRSLMEDAISEQGKVRFTYNGKERVFSPTRMYFNPKTGNTNVVGFDETNGEERTYTLERVEIVPRAPEKSAPGVNPVDDRFFDEMFETPEGAYKPNIFEYYQPVGRTDEESADYTDDPEELATRFDAQELVLALRQAVMPDLDSGEPATGFGMLEFDAGDESVPAEALYEAIQRAGGPSPDMVLATIYDQGFPEDASRITNVDRLLEISGEIFESMESPARSQIPTSDEDVDRVSTPPSAQAGLRRAQRAVELMLDHEETNPQILEVARFFNDDQLGGGPTSFDDAFEGMYPMAISDDPEQREAFAAFWGVLMSLSGGDLDLNDEAINIPGSSADRMVSVIRNLGSQTPEADFLDLVDTYGDYPEYIRGKSRINDGVDDLSADSVAASFFRLTAASGKKNSEPIYRVMNFTPGDPEYTTVTTEGSILDFDSRPFTALDLADGTAASGWFYRQGGVARVVIEAPAGTMSVLEVEGASPFPDERERIAFGRVEVVSVRRERTGIGDEMQDIVTVRPVDQPTPAEAAPAAPAGAGVIDSVVQEFTTPITGIEGWTQFGGQTGSNRGGFFRDADGNEYYVKVPKSQSHADNETLASAFYQILGVPAAKMLRGDDDGELRIVSPLIPDADTDDFRSRVREDDDEYLEKVRDGFVIDAWLANWDSVGLVYDNIVTDANGNPVRVDPGGSLMYRAQGAPKGSLFGNVANEIDTLRDPGMNPQAESVFGTITDDQLRRSAMRLRDITPSQIDEVVDSIVSDPGDADLLKERLKARRKDILDRFGIPEGADDSELFPDPIPLTEAMGYQAQDLLPGDVTAADSFVIEKVFYDDETPKGKVSIQGYFPGHESQRKEWNPETEIEVARGGTIPPKGDKPALHRPKRPYAPRTQETFTGDMADALAGAQTWDEAAEIIRGTEIVYFDYETTGLGEGELNRPVQIGAVRVVNGEVVERFNAYMNPEFRLSDWSKENLKREDGELVTDEWLETQPSMREVHEQFLEFVGDRPILGGQNVPFDLEVLERTLSEQGLELEVGGTIDSLPLARGTLPKWSAKTGDGPMAVGADGKRRSSYSLGPVAEYLGVELGNWHRADADAEAAWGITDAMLDRATSGDFDVPTNSFDGTDSERINLERAEYEAEMEVYADELAAYEAAKAVAAAWNCGGAGLTAAVGSGNGPCDVPDPDDLIKNATPKPESADRDGTAVGPTDGSNSLEGANDTPDVERPEMDGVDVKDPYADEAFPPTDQQKGIVDAVLTGDNVVVRALAGTGKTSTLKLIARRLKKDRPKDRIAYVAFNKAIQLEADATMPNNVESRTGDSIAWRAVDSDLKNKRSKNKFNNAPSKQADHFGITGQPNPDDPNDQMSAVQVTRAIQKAINNYTISADDEIGPQHFEFDNVPDEWLAKANEMWADINNVNGWLPFNNNHATKIWALTRPDLSKPGSGLDKPASVIFFDEAQDINPVMAKVIADQSIQVIYVGDGNQAIYAFRGAVDELQNVEAPHDLPLTKSWRFGPQVAGIGNRFLSLLKSPHRIEGGGPDGEIVPSGSMNDADAVLVRTNAGAFKEIFRELENGRTVGITKSHKDDLERFADHAAWLINGADQDTRPSSMHEDLAAYKTWDEVRKAVADDDDTSRKLKALVELVEEIGINEFSGVLDRLITYNASTDIADVPSTTPGEAVSGASGTVAYGVDFTIMGDAIVLKGNTFEKKDAIKKAGFKWNPADKTWRKSAGTDQARAAEINKLRNELTGSNKPDVVITTAHRSKGLEWDRVRIGDDFWGPKADKETGELKMPADEELRLDYVAATRAKKQLDPGGLDWIFDVTSDADESSAAPSAPDAEPEVPGELPPPVPMERVDIAAPEQPVEISDADRARETAKYELEDEGEGSFQAVGSPNSWIVQQFGDTWTAQVSGEKLPDSKSFGEAKARYDEKVAEVVERDLSAPRASTETPSEPIPDPDTVSGNSSAPDDLEDTVDLTANPTPADPARDTPSDVSTQPVEFDPASEPSFADDLDNSIEDVESSLSEAKFNSPSVRTAAKKALSSALKALQDYRDGSISQSEALDILREAEKNAAELKFAGSDKMIGEFVKQSITDARRILDGTAYGPATFGKGLPPEGSKLGFDKNGVFIKPGMRVRDKWGYAGTVVRYNISGGFINVYIRKDVDHRDPDAVKSSKSAQRFGPGFIDSKGTKTLTVIRDGDDNSPYVPVMEKGEEKKAPANFEEQLKELERILGDEGEGPVGIDKTPTPSGDDDSGAADAGSTEALRENIEERAGQEAWSGEESERVDSPKAEAPAGAEDDASKIAADNEEEKRLRESLKDLGSKGSLTKEEAEEFASIAKRINELSFERENRTPATVDNVVDADARKSTLSPETNLVAYNDMLQNKEAYMAIRNAAAGVAFDADTDVDKIVDGDNPEISAAEFYQTFDATREALRAQYGDTIPLFRAVGKQKKKSTTNWATTREFAEQFGDDVVEENIPVERVLAVNVTRNGRYHEVIVLDEDYDIESVAGDTEEEQAPTPLGVDNSAEVTTALGTTIAMPNVLDPTVNAAPDHTPEDKELFDLLVGEGPNAVGSTLTKNWVDHVEEYGESGAVDQDAIDALEYIESFGDSKKLFEASKGNAFLQNLRMAIALWVAQGPQDSAKSDGTASSSYIADYVEIDLIPNSRRTTRSLYTDLARYYNDPSLIDKEMTPAAALLRALRVARVKSDRSYIRYISFVDKRLDDPSHPLHRLGFVGQEFDLRPSSWADADTPDIDLAQILPLDSYNFEPEEGSIIRLKISGVQALDISKTSPLPDERESIPTNGRYRVASVEEVEIEDPYREGDYKKVTEITLELVEDGADVETPEPEAAPAPEATPEAAVELPDLPPSPDADTDIVDQIKAANPFEEGSPEWAYYDLVAETVATMGTYKSIEDRIETAAQVAEASREERESSPFQKLYYLSNASNEWLDSNMEPKAHPRPTQEMHAQVLLDMNPFEPGSPHYQAYRNQALSRTQEAFNPSSTYVSGDRLKITSPEHYDSMFDYIVSYVEKYEGWRYSIDVADDDWVQQNLKAGDLVENARVYRTPGREVEGVTFTLSKDGVWEAAPGAYNLAQAYKSGRLTPDPDMLPMFISMNPDEDGEGYYFAKSGKRYWGRFGAAGALMAFKDEDGVTRYVLGRRAAWISAGGGKWGIPGGAHSNRVNSESPGVTASQELAEELGVALPDSMPDLVWVDDVEPDWAYATSVFTVDAGTARSATISDNETSEIGFFTAEELAQLLEDGELHPALEKTLPKIVESYESKKRVGVVSSLKPYDPLGFLAARKALMSKWKSLGFDEQTVKALGYIMTEPEGILKNPDVRPKAVIDRSRALGVVEMLIDPDVNRYGAPEDRAWKVQAAVVGYIAAGRPDIAAHYLHSIYEAIQTTSKESLDDDENAALYKLSRELVAFGQALAEGQFDDAFSISADSLIGDGVDNFVSRFKESDAPETAAMVSRALNGYVELVENAKSVLRNDKDLADSIADLFIYDSRGTIEQSYLLSSGTGSPTVVLKSEVPLSESLIDGVPSVQDAIDSVTSDSGHAVAHALVDGGNVEDASIEVFNSRFVDRDGTSTDGVTMTYKLTPWAAQIERGTIERDMSANLTDRWSRSTAYYVTEKTLEDGVVVETKDKFTDSRGLTYEDNYMRVYEYKGDGFTVRFATTSAATDYSRGYPGYTDGDPSRYSSLKTDINKVTIFFTDKNPSEDTIKAAMKIGGIDDPRPATEADVRTLIENRIISLFGKNVLGTDLTNPAKNLTEHERIEALDMIEDAHMITADDFTVEVDPASGLPMIVASERTGEYIASTFIKGYGADPDNVAFWHSGGSPTGAADFIEKTLLGGEDGRLPGLHSTAKRFRMGINAAGQSSRDDYGVGSADYVYTGVRAPGYVGDTISDPRDFFDATFVFKYDPKQMLRRFDWWANYNDRFGERTHDNPLDELNDSTYEVMFKNSLGLFGLEAIYTNIRERRKIIERLEARGVTELNGIPLRSFFRIFGDTITDDDFSVSIDDMLIANGYQPKAQPQMEEFSQYG